MKKVVTPSGHFVEVDAVQAVVHVYERLQMNNRYLGEGIVWAQPRSRSLPSRKSCCMLFHTLFRMNR